MRQQRLVHYHMIVLQRNSYITLAKSSAGVANAKYIQLAVNSGSSCVKNTGLAKMGTLKTSRQRGGIEKTSSSTKYAYMLFKSNSLFSKQPTLSLMIRDIYHVPFF